MSKPKLIGGLILIFILGALAGAWGNQLYFMHFIKHRFERFAEGGPMPFMFGHRMEGCGKIINELDLTADQKKKVDNILTKKQDERKKLMDSLREAQEQLNKVVSSKEFDEAAFRQGFQQVSSLKENLAVLRAKVIPELKAVLSPEQIGYLRGRMEAKKEFCKKNLGCLGWKGHHRSLVEPDIHPPKPQEQGDQPNS